MENIERTNLQLRDMFRIVEFSSISLNDEFFNHVPQTQNQMRVKNSIIYAKKSDFKDFAHAIMDPSVNENERIYYQHDHKPAVGYSPIWWNTKAKEVLPEKNSRLGSPLAYDVFLSTHIKYLVEQRNYSVDLAWKSICDDSQEFGNYISCSNVPTRFKNTGNNQLGEWYDLSNTCKILCSGDEYFLASGFYCFYGKNFPFARIRKISILDGNYHYASGWIICDV